MLPKIIVPFVNMLSFLISSVYFHTMPTNVWITDHFLFNISFLNLYFSYSLRKGHFYNNCALYSYITFVHNKSFFIFIFSKLQRNHRYTGTYNYWYITSITALLLHLDICIIRLYWSSFSFFSALYIIHTYPL